MIRKRRKAISTLKNENDITLNFFRWCSKQRWDWLMGLPYSNDRSSSVLRRTVLNWLREIERADATRFFRWVQFKPLEYMRKSTEAYLLVGGLGSGAWRCWARRWASMNADEDLSGWVEWNAKDRKPLAPVLTKLIRERQFVDVDMRLGSSAYFADRLLKVDRFGMPTDPVMLRALKVVKKPKDRKEPRTKRVLWQSLLDESQVIPTPAKR
ncbi:MAG TPA: hypothetical protein VGH07_07935 [Chthoniobacterales bacterium]|jgi:hypothetical protein